MTVPSNGHPNRTSLFSRLRRWRVSNGLTLDDVSDLCGLSPSMISRVERGERMLRPRTKVLIARRLGVRTSEIFEPTPEISDPLEPVSGS
ncbi:MAG TPA: helix-turn-helix transcriptional regulator [Candidatus Dormibacteraeota bacterium]|nr:helix-turn-helix transcriptional regulator [Candidatus Dormibacteraeota bacterium]